MIYALPAITFSKDYRQWGLPEGAKARLGKGLIQDISYSPGGKRLAVGSSIGVWLYDAQTGEELTLLTGQKAWVWGVIFSPDGKQLAAHGNLDNRVYVWDTQTWTLRHTLSHDKVWNSINSVVFSPDGQLLASCGSLDNTINLWDPKTGSRIGSLKHNLSGSPSAKTLAFSPDGEILISQSTDKIIFWDIEMYHPIRTLTLPDELSDELFYMIALSPDGEILAGTTKKGIYLWDTNTGAIKHTMEASLENNQITFSPNGQFLLQNGYYAAFIHIWDVKTGRYVTSFSPGIGPPVLGVEKTFFLHNVFAWTFTPDGNTIAIAISSGHIELWDANTLSVLKQQFIYGYTDRVESVAFSPDGRTIASGHSDSYIRLWDANTGELNWILSGHRSNVKSVIFINPTEPILVSVDWGGVVVFRDYNALGSGKVLRVIETRAMHTGVISGIAVSQDGKTLASGSHDGTVSLWNAGTGEHLHSLSINSLAESVAFSPDGKKLASNGRADAVLWDVRTGSLLHNLRRGEFLFGGGSVAFSPNGRIIANTFRHDSVAFPRPPWDGIDLWDVKTGKLLWTIRMEEPRILTFSPDGKLPQGMLMVKYTSVM